MIIESVSAPAFGPLCGDAKLELSPGMTVIHGLNESGKSTWHAAIFAALCGLRRARGRNQEDREFRERHKPWQGSGWRVAAKIHLCDGRRIEIRQDLDGRVDCRAMDLDLARDCSNEIMFDGSPDASRWLGLDRRSFPAIALVRQTEILEVKSEAGALQQHIQRAADTAGVDETAAAALARIEAFRSVNTGLVRPNVNRPLAKATRAFEAARRSLDTARQQLASYLELVANAERLQGYASDAETRLQLFRAALAGRAADLMQGRIDRIRELQQLFPNGEPPALAADDDLAQQVSAALQAWAQRPTPPALVGASSEQLRAQIAELPPPPADDTAPAKNILDAQAHVTYLDARLADHATSMPARPAQVGSGLPKESSSNNVESTRAAGNRSPLVLIGAVAALLLGVAVFALGAPLVGAVVILASIGGAVFFWLTKLRPGASVSDQGIRPSTADDAYETSLQNWKVQAAELNHARSSAVEALAEALRSRGVLVAGTDRDAVQASYDLYIRQCEERRSAAALANRRDDLEARLRDREQAEQSATVANEQIARAREGILAAAARCDVDDSTVPGIQTGLQAWLQNRSRRLQQDQERRNSWAELQTLLDGNTVEDAEASVQRERALAQRLSAGLLGSIELESDTQSQGDRLEHAAGDANRAAHEAIGMVDERHKSVPNVAQAEEDLARCEAELQRLRRLDGILERTHEFLARAQEHVHRTIAPVLASELAAWLPQLTAGRYHQVIVDPETLDVEVAGADDMYRRAYLLSHGTAEQVYLLLRAVLAQHLTVNGEVCPLILDDVTVHCDNQRQQAMLCALQQLSAGRQVVLFTQEHAVLRWAEENFTTPRDSIIKLPAPRPLLP